MGSGVSGLILCLGDNLRNVYEKSGLGLVLSPYDPYCRMIIICQKVHFLTEIDI